MVLATNITVDGMVWMSPSFWQGVILKEFLFGPPLVLDISWVFGLVLYQLLFISLYILIQSKVACTLGYSFQGCFSAASFHS